MALVKVTLHNAGGALDSATVAEEHALAAAIRMLREAGALFGGDKLTIEYGTEG